MHWVVKAAAARVLSALPMRERVRYVLQRHVLRTLPLSEPEFTDRLGAADEHVRRYLAAGLSTPLEQATFFEFGAGWDLAIPLAFALAGVGRQVVVDLTPLARPDIVALTLDRLRARGASTRLPGLVGARARWERFPRQGPRTPRELRGWLARVGIDYRAPADARATGLADRCIDCVTSTATLEHIPPEDIGRILREMRRILRPGGVLSCRVDMSDHYSHADPRLTPWHFLELSEPAWRAVNAPVLYQNRLRGSAYLRLAREAGFDLVDAELAFPRARPPGAAPRVHPSFTDWTDERDLMATSLRLLARAGAAQVPQAQPAAHAQARTVA